MVGQKVASIVHVEPDVKFARAERYVIMGSVEANAKLVRLQISVRTVGFIGTVPSATGANMASSRGSVSFANGALPKH
jgi:hypothetical protein